MKELLELAEGKGFECPPVKAVTWLSATNNSETEDYIILCLIQKWLREEHGIHVEVEVIFNPKSYGLMIWQNESNMIDYEGFKTYEQALQKGLEEGLKLI
jgi:hypothetical protein